MASMMLTFLIKIHSYAIVYKACSYMYTNIYKTYQNFRSRRIKSLYRVLMCSV